MADAIQNLCSSGDEPSTSSIQNSASTVPQQHASRNLADNQTPPKNIKGKKKRTKKQPPVKMSEEEEMKNRINSEAWVNAPEFVPRDNAAPTSNASTNVKINNDSDKSKKRLCPHEERDGMCRYPAGECTYLHGDVCDLCARPALHPHNADQRRQHTQACIRQHEPDMELSFAMARSNEKVCGVCFEIVIQKAIGERRFGILPNCNHCFCLACIRKWRSSRQFENKIIRACPECRVTSDFVCPSNFWVDTKEEKDRAIENYLHVLSVKDCKYFLGGRGCCPFGNKCFYRHCMRDGTQVDVGPPPSVRNAVAADVGNGPGSGGNAGSGTGAGTTNGAHDASNLLQSFLIMNYLHDEILRTISADIDVLELLLAEDRIEGLEVLSLM